MFVILALALPAACAPQHTVSTTTETLPAVDSKTIAEITGRNWQDNRLRAYWAKGNDGFLDGLIKFDLSSIPDASTITGLTLRVYHEQGYNNPFDNPEVRAYRVDDDSWARGATDPHPGLGEILTPVMTGFPVGNIVPFDFEIDIHAANWQVDLLDDTLSILLRNEAGAVDRYSYVYFFGSDSNLAPPELIIEYLDGPTLIVSNAVAGGSAIIELINAKPGASGIVAWSQTSGSTTLNTPWGGFTVDLELPIQRLHPFSIDPTGYGVTTARIPAGASGRTVFMQALLVGPGPEARLSNSLMVSVL